MNRKPPRPLTLTATFWCSLGWMLLGSGGGMAAPTMEVVHHWDYQPGQPSLNELCEGADGNLYGASFGGGLLGRGCLYRLSKSGSLTVLTSFTRLTPPAPGGDPVGRLLRTGEGDFYGVTAGGGGGEQGTIFKLSASGTFTSLFQFGGTATTIDPGPHGGLVRGLDGTFYGTVRGVGTLHGSIFKMSPQGTVTTLVNFSGTTGASKGAHPSGALAFGNDGNLYGTTDGGGAAGRGTIYRMTPAGVLTTLVEFTGIGGAAPGEAPTGSLLLGADGNFYGTTYYGGLSVNGGTLFRMSPSGTLTTLVAFTDGSGALRGSHPSSGLIAGKDGMLYGVTTYGGTGGFGTVFKSSLEGDTAVTLADFGPATLVTPTGALLLASDGNFYGTASGGGPRGAGGVYRMTPAGALSTVIAFAVDGAPLNGAAPVGSLTLGSDGNFYGSTKHGGTSNRGTVFRFSPDGQFTSLAEFPDYPNYLGSFPQDSLAEGPDGNFYGAVSTQGILGTSLFRMTPQGGLSTAYEFTGPTSATSGGAPAKALVLAGDGHFYGATTQGAANDQGALFQWQPNGPLTTLAAFSGTTGPVLGRDLAGPMLSNAGDLYGVTTRGGPLLGTGDTAVSHGTLFRLTPGGTFSTLLTFTGNGATNKGSRPAGGLASDGDGFFYGTTNRGGAADAGTIFQVTPGGTLTTLAEFTGATGSVPGFNPLGQLVSRGDGRWYGVTSRNATGTAGSVYSVTKLGTVTTLFSFNQFSSNGAAGPASGLALGPDGNLYGLDQAGPGGAGAIYRLRFGPTPVTLGADHVTATGAQLHATVNPNGESTTVSFEWGATSSLGNQTAGQVLPAGSAPVAVRATLSGISPTTAPYYFRVKAVNATGTQYGPTQSFSALGPLAGWKLSHLGDAAADDDGDPDRDGLTTLAEYGLGLAPESFEVVGQPTAEVFDYPESRRLRLRIDRFSERTDVTIEVQAADSFTGPWTTLATSTAGAPFSGAGYVGGDDPTPGHKSVEVRDIVDVGVSTSRFLRVRVTR